MSTPYYVVWDTTLLCNARCVHCYADAGPKNPMYGLSTQQGLQLINQLADGGVFVLALGGGEVLLRKDWATLASHAVKKGLQVSIGTNGSPVTPEAARRIKEAGVSSVCVSLDGASAATHDRIRRFEGLFDKAVAAIGELVSRSISVQVGFTPMKFNHFEMEHVVDLASRLGAERVNLSEYVPIGRGKLEYALSPDELRGVFHRWIELEGRYRGKMKLLWHDCRATFLAPPQQSSKYSGCGVGKTHCRIAVNGDVTPCVMLPISAGNVLERNFVDIWRTSPILGKLRDRENIGGNCGECGYLQVCGGCRALSYSYTGNLFGGDPYCWIKPDRQTAAPAVAKVNQ